MEANLWNWTWHRKVNMHLVFVLLLKFEISIFMFKDGPVHFQYLTGILKSAFFQEYKGHVNTDYTWKSTLCHKCCRLSFTCIDPGIMLSNHAWNAMVKFFLHSIPTAYQKHPLGINVEMLNCLGWCKAKCLWQRGTNYMEVYSMWLVSTTVWRS